MQSSVAFIVAFWLALGLGIDSLQAAEPISNKTCLDCHEDPSMVVTNAAGMARSLYVDLAKLTNSVHATNLCVSCHADLTEQHPDDNVPAKPAACAACHQRQIESYGASVHGAALRAGATNAATCASCHGNHNILRVAAADSPVRKQHLAAMCGECHPKEAAEIQESVHGTALANGLREVPTCTDCHSEHSIQGLRGEASLKVSAEICGKCHASEKLSTKYRLPADRVKTFFESYHGLAVQGRSTRVANCGSCHGFHLVLPSSDPRSMIHTNNLVATCGKCHPGATANFAGSKVHVDADSGNDVGAVVNRWIKRFYYLLIGGTMAVLGSYVLLILGRKAVVARRNPDRTVVRLSPAFRAQHFLLALSFFILSLSGFALKFPESWLALLFGSDEIVRSWVHRVVGALLLGVGAYHVWFVTFTREGRQLIRDFLPCRKDLSDIAQNVQYLLGRRPTPPKFARFNYIEKFEYWAVVWGTIIMGVTGIVVWIKIPVTYVLPRWVLEAALAIHYYEAILAVSAVVVCHFYHVMFDPDIYPMNWAWFDGKVSAKIDHEERLQPSSLAAQPPSQSKLGKT